MYMGVCILDGSQVFVIETQIFVAYPLPTASNDNSSCINWSQTCDGEVDCDDGIKNKSVL